MIVVQNQENTPLPAASVTPTDPADHEAGSIGSGEPYAPELNTGPTDGITIPSGEHTPGAPVISGDQDAGGNDPNYIDEILWPNPDSFQPEAEMVAEALFSDEKLKALKPQTKIQQACVPAGAFNVGSSAFDPVMLFPPDSDRQELLIRAVSTVATTWRFGSDKQSCYTAASIPTGDSSITLHYHTGPVWVYSPDITNPFTISGWAVTK